MPSRINYRAIVPAGSFIANYMESMDDVETPGAYDFWCACWLLSVALGRSIRIERPRAPVFMNLYAILVAEAGVTRKSTAVKAATEIARQFMNASAPHMRIIQNAMTASRMLLLLNDLTEEYGTSQIAIAIDELVTVLGKQNYTLPGLLTDYYDCPSQRSGGSYGEGLIINVRNSFVSLLGASTPSWLNSSITGAIIEGGFTSRCLFIVAEARKRRIPWPQDRDTSAASFASSLGDIRLRATRIQQDVGGIPISEGGRKEFAAWYGYRDEHRDPFRGSFEAREDHHVLRLAGFLCVSDGTWEIQYTHIKHAIRIIKAIKEDGAELFAKHTPIGKEVAGVAALCERLSAAGRAGLSQTQLGLGVGRYMTREQMNLCLAIMHEGEFVQKFEVRDSKFGKPITLWRATTRIRTRGAQAMIMRDLEKALVEAQNRSVSTDA